MGFRRALLTGIALASLAAPAAHATPFATGVKPLFGDRVPDDSACGSADVRTGWGTFVAGRWPSGCWRPYAASSPFNRPIPAGARSVAGSRRMVETLAGWGRGPSPLRAGIADTDGDFQHPTYYSQPADPTYTVHCLKPWGRCEVEGARVRIPSRARAAGGSDAHLTVVDQAGGMEYDFWQVRSKPAGGGTLDISWGGTTPIGGDGLASDSTAAQFGNLAGVIRAEELQRGRIDHALFMVVKCDSGGFVYPARGRGAACPDGSAAPPEGARFQLTLSPARIARLPVPRWKRAILTAFARYGAYVGDTGGSPWDIELESSSTYTSFGFADPMVAFARRAGVPRDSDGRYSFDLASGIDWRRDLRVVDTDRAPAPR